MKIVYLVRNCDDAGEYEGMFDTSGILLGIWTDNDATWRSYFDNAMLKLGIKIEYKDDKKWTRKLRAAAKLEWGI